MPDIERTLGEHASKLENMGEDIAEIKSDVKQLLAAKSEFEGARKTLYTIAALIGAGSASLVTYAQKFLR
jgi:prefoldin subunit 5